VVIGVDLYKTLNHWAPIIGQLGIALTGVMAFIGGLTLVFSYFSNRRDATRLRQDQWRISYRNLSITHSVLLTHTAKATPAAPEGSQETLAALAPPGEMSLTAPAGELSQFLLFRLKVENIGDGPVDVWACLVAARELNAGDHRESWGGNIEWNDLDAYYFDTTSLTNPTWERLAGISNTRHCVYSQDDYLQLDPKEHDTLTRIDRIEPVLDNLTLLYRVFLVGRGYGGSMNDSDVRNMLAWQRLQQALFNISGPSFRILFDVDDPLDMVADRDGFQCFLLYHEAFVEDRRDARGLTHIDQLNTELEGAWGSRHPESVARARCAQELVPETDRWGRHWQAFTQAVAECKRLEDGFVGLMRTRWRPKDVAPPADKSALDLVGMSAKAAYHRLPKYLKWDPRNEDSLPVWEYFYVTTLKPEDASRSDVFEREAVRRLTR
jgi:hypothetical protein